MRPDVCRNAVSIDDLTHICAQSARTDQPVRLPVEKQTEVSINNGSAAFGCNYIFLRESVHYFGLFIIYEMHVFALQT